MSDRNPQTPGNSEPADHDGTPRQPADPNHAADDHAADANHQGQEDPQLMERLDRQGETAHEVMREASAWPDAPGQQQVADFLAAKKQEFAQRQGQQRRRVILLSVTAAAVTLVSTFFLFPWGAGSSGGGGDLPITPIGLPIRILAPIDGGAFDARIEWEGELSASGVFEVQIFDADAAAGSAALLTHKTRDSIWTLSEKELESLSGRVRLEISSWAGNRLIHSVTRTVSLKE